jgi:hypothetical protein
MRAAFWNPRLAFTYRLDRWNDKAFRPLRKALGPIVDEQKSKFFEPPLPRQAASNEVCHCALNLMKTRQHHYAISWVTTRQEIASLALPRTLQRAIASVNTWARDIESQTISLLFAMCFTDLFARPAWCRRQRAQTRCSSHRHPRHGKRARARSAVCTICIVSSSSSCVSVWLGSSVCAWRAAPVGII